MNSSSLFRIGGIVLILAAIVNALNTLISTFLFPDTGPDIPPTAVTSSTWSTVETVGLVCGILLLFGYIALYAYQSRRAGIVGLLGFVLTLLGSLLTGIVVSFFGLLVLPFVASHNPALFGGAFGLLALPGLGGGLVLIIGTILLGISVLRAKVYPRIAGILILVSGILLPAGILGLNLIVSLIGTVGTIIGTVGFVLIGYTLFRQPQVESELQPSFSVAPQS